MESETEKRVREYWAKAYDTKNKNASIYNIGSLDFTKNNDDNDKQNQIPLNKNEYTYLNRNQNDDLIAGWDGIGYDNWEHSFSEIFTNSGWNVYRVRSYLKTFHSYHLNVSHNRPDSFMNFNHPDVHQFMLDSMKIMIIINESYSLFLERVKKAEIPGSTTMGYYFYLNGGTVQPVRVSQTNREKISELFKESKTITIDFSCPSILEERFRINYQELFAILSDLMKEVKITKHGPLIDFRIK